MKGGDGKVCVALAAVPAIVPPVAKILICGSVWAETAREALKAAPSNVLIKSRIEAPPFQQGLAGHAPNEAS